MDLQTYAQISHHTCNYNYHNPNIFTGLQNHSRWKKGEPLILGYCPASIIIDSLLKDTWTNEYDNYQTDFETLDSLEGKLEDITIKIVFRSTCSDSREQLPRLFKILNELNYNVNSITLIGVNRQKQGL